jgi:ribosomal protein L7/L12
MTTQVVLTLASSGNTILFPSQFAADIFLAEYNLTGTIQPAHTQPEHPLLKTGWARWEKFAQDPRREEIVLNTLLSLANDNHETAEAALNEIKRLDAIINVNEAALPIEQLADLILSRHPDNNITAIKELRRIRSLSLYEAKRFIDAADTRRSNRRHAASA